MKDVSLRYNDHELFDTMFFPEHYSFIVSHMDAFKRMWNEQSKSFWCKHLTMFRHHCYNFGTVHCLNNEAGNLKSMSLDCMTVLADQVFVVLHDEFVNCRYGVAKELINDLAVVIANRSLIFACKNPSIKNNPFYFPEVRDVFRKLLGCCRSYPPGMKEFYLTNLAYPIYGIFGGSIYHILRRWLHASDIRTTPEVYLKNCWEIPPELKNPSFVPQPYHRHLLEKNGDQVDRLLMHGCFGLFSSNRISPDEGFFNSKGKENGEKLSFGTSSHVFETFIEFISNRQWFPNDKLDAEDLNYDFNKYLREKVEDFEDEEFRRSMVLKMAEKKFQEELEKENSHKEKSKGKNCTTKEKEKISEINNEKKCASQQLTHPSSTTTTSKSLSQEAVSKTSTEIVENTVLNNNNNKKTVSVEVQTSEPKTVDRAQAVNLQNSKSASTDSKNKPCETSVTPVPSEGSVSSTGKKSKKKKKKKTTPAGEDSNSKTNSTQTNGNSSKNKSMHPESNSKSNSNGTVKENNSTTKSSTTQKSQTAEKPSLPVEKQPNKAVPKGSAAELVKIKKNIDTIKQSVQEQDGLSLDGFRLMVETGSLLMSGKSKDKTSGPVLQSCTQCRKTEAKPKSFKKCARCISENMKWVRYYCSRECQAENWVSCHQDEHDNGWLVKK